MRAFVKVNNGTFPNVNFYMAWEAFNTMGYSVTLFEEKDIDTLEVTPDTPVFAGVTIFKRIIDKMGVNYPPFDCYPEVLKPYYGRNLRKSTLGEVRNQFHKDSVKVFVKPVKPKVFTGVVLESLLNLIPIARVPDDTEVYACEPMEILSEYRVYVHDGDILGVKHYYGEWYTVPSEGFIKGVIRNYKPSPIAYGIDVGVYKDYSGYEPDLGLYGKGPVNTSFVIEVNDGCNLGNYGLDSIYYGEMIVARWFEIMSEHRVDKKIEETSELFRGSVYEKDYTKESFDKPITEDFKYSRKELMLKSQIKVAREESMKSFAEEVMKQLKEEK